MSIHRALTQEEERCLALDNGVGSPSPEYRAWLEALREISPLHSEFTRLRDELYLRDPVISSADRAALKAAIDAAWSAYLAARPAFRALGSNPWEAPANWPGCWRPGALCADGNYRPVSTGDGYPVARDAPILPAPFLTRPPF